MTTLYPQEITRVLLNLISNGFYAAAKRKTEAGDDAFEPTLSATTKSLGDKVEIRIRDNGTGIPDGSKGENIQSLLHDQARRRRYRTWSVNEPRHHRETTRWQDRRRDRAGAVYRVQDRLAAEGPNVNATPISPIGQPRIRLLIALV